jgi:glucosamine 6-phosphate synthetase-like amidotransferase/phosphosugar isomerase protein
MSNIREIQARGTVTIVIAEEADETVRRYVDHLIEIPAVSMLSSRCYPRFHRKCSRPRSPRPGYDVDNQIDLAALNATPCLPRTLDDAVQVVL